MPATTQPSANPAASRASSSAMSMSLGKEPCNNSGMSLSPGVPAQAVLRDGARTQAHALHDLLERRRQCRVKLELQNDLSRQQRQPVLRRRQAPLIGEGAMDAAVEGQPQGTFAAGGHKSGALVDDAASRTQPSFQESAVEPGARPGRRAE